MNVRQIPSVRLSLRAILSDSQESDTPLNPRQQIQQQLNSADYLNRHSVSPHRIAPKCQPIKQLSNICQKQARKRFQLQPPPNDYATFKKDNQVIKALFDNDECKYRNSENKNKDIQRKQRIYDLMIQQKILVHSPKEYTKNGTRLFEQSNEQILQNICNKQVKNRIECLFNELLHRLQNEDNKEQKIINIRQQYNDKQNKKIITTDKKYSKSINLIIQKSRQQIQLQQNIMQLNQALRLKR